MQDTIASESNDLPALRQIIGRVGIAIDATAGERLLSYRRLLLEANKRFNLTSITDPDAVEVRILADSLLLLPFIPVDAERLLDVGTGGGVPGMVLAIARPDVHVTLVDATGKKVRFLTETATELGLSHVTAIQGRAEELGQDLRYRETFNVVTARAVARLVTLVELTLPFARVGGTIILPKGGAALEEFEEASYAIRLLGGAARPVQTTPVEETNVIVIDKRSPTRNEYPRRVGMPNKTPLLRRTPLRTS